VTQFNACAKHCVIAALANAAIAANPPDFHERDRLLLAVNRQQELAQMLLPH